MLVLGFASAAPAARSRAVPATAQVSLSISIPPFFGVGRSQADYDSATMVHTSQQAVRSPAQHLLVCGELRLGSSSQKLEIGRYEKQPHTLGDPFALLLRRRVDAETHRNSARRRFRRDRVDGLADRRVVRVAE